MKLNYSIITNFYINDEETLLRMKDSFVSFKKANCKKWILNIRGKYKHQAADFIKSYLNSECNIHFLILAIGKKKLKIFSLN